MASQNIYVVSLDAIPAYGAHSLEQFSRAGIAAFIRDSKPDDLESIATDILAEEGWQVTNCHGIYGPTTLEQVYDDDAFHYAFTSATKKGFSAVIVAFPATLH